MALEALRCPQCHGEVDLDDNQEYGFCKYCGTKVQNIRSDRLKVEGKFEINKEKDLNNLLILARRSKDTNDNDQAKKYYDEVLLMDPNNWEAQYYNVYYNCYDYYNQDKELSSFDKACDKIINNLSIVFNLIKISKMSNAEKNECYNQIGQSLDALRNHWIGSYNPQIRGINFELHEKKFGEIYEKIGDLFVIQDDKIHAEEYYDKCFDLYCRDKDLIERINEKIIKINPEFEKVSTSACYVATCVYGSYDCPEVWVLRRFRDNFLDKYLLGRIFIRTYYAISPKIVRILGKTKGFKSLNKKILDRFVSLLKIKGYEDTKYIDKY